jgi:hypothetical protein
MNTRIWGYRGDTRDDATLRDHGGFVPQYLLRDHTNGFDGFLACMHKTNGKIGCNCRGFTERDLFNKARHTFLELMKKPINLQAHVMFNKDGYISTAIGKDDSYSGYQYLVEGWCYEYSIHQAAQRFRIAAKIPGLVKGWKVYVETMNVGQATLIAMTPAGGVELTFITPILYKHIKYKGYKP